MTGDYYGASLGYNDDGTFHVNVYSKDGDGMTRRETLFYSLTEPAAVSLVRVLECAIGQELAA